MKKKRLRLATDTAFQELPGRLFIGEGDHSGQLFSFEIFEGSAAAGGDVAHLVRETGLVHRRDAVAAADDRDAAVGFDFGDCLADAESAVREFRHFEAAHRSVPDHGLRLADRFGVEFGGLRADVERHPAGRNVVADDLGVGFGVELVRRDVVDREQKVDLQFLRLCDHLVRVVELVEFAEGVADVVTLRLEERVGHAAADDQRVDFGQQVLDYGEFIGDLRAAEDGDERTDRFLHRTAEVGDLFFHQESGDRRFQEFRDDRG
ncbi:hypothetical protein SDC9_160927 [bioreactor metagenome]|uniref:Uncharacterized protein n=1 Tax=bioreactor metagenome TaxID=1076179 RepID=A0A645FGR4_9ZZZZ